MLGSCGIGAHEVVHRSVLGEATYNTAYRLQLTGGDRLVLKIAPDPTAPGLTYEKNLMRTEAEFYRRASGVVPVPTVVHADFTRQILDSDFLLMTELPGDNWYSQAAQLEDDDKKRLRTELGRLVAALHDLDGPEFGYPNGRRSASWRLAFTGMLEDLIADTEHYGPPLPRSLKEITTLLFAHLGALDDVATPRLVHFDLWAGNILVKDGAITGIVDGERAFWGDPLADMASLALFLRIEDDVDFLTGYGELDRSGPAMRRLALYRCYLYLIMLAEGGPRGYSGPERDRFAHFTSSHLNAALTELDR